MIRRLQPAMNQNPMGRSILCYTYEMGILKCISDKVKLQPFRKGNIIFIVKEWKQRVGGNNNTMKEQIRELMVCGNFWVGH